MVHIFIFSLFFLIACGGASGNSGTAQDPVAESGDRTDPPVAAPDTDDLDKETKDSFKDSETDVNADFPLINAGIPEETPAPDPNPAPPIEEATPEIPVEPVPEVPVPGLAGLSEEFNDPFDLLHFTDLNSGAHDILDVAFLNPGRLTLSPINVAETGWYSENRGAFLYKEVTGNFMVEVELSVGRQTNAALAPRGQFNSAGLVLRDPESRLGGLESWVMYNFGNQLNGLAREAKTTRPNPGNESLSTFYLTPLDNPVLTGALRLCRVDNGIYLFHRMAGAASWTEEAYTPLTNLYGNGMYQPTPGTVRGGPIRFIRDDLPATLEIGLTAGNWSPPFDTLAQFDYMRFYEVNSPEDCAADF